MHIKTEKVNTEKRLKQILFVCTLFCRKLFCFRQILKRLLPCRTEWLCVFSPKLISKGLSSEGHTGSLRSFPLKKGEISVQTHCLLVENTTLKVQAEEAFIFKPKIGITLLFALSYNKVSYKLAFFTYMYTQYTQHEITYITYIVQL